MASSTPSAPTIAIFGATGGTGLSVLRRSLDSGLQVNVLARTPSKLTPQFPSTKYPNLSIIQGDVRDAEAIRKTLTINNRVADIVVSAIGMIPTLRGSWDTTICEDGVRGILAGVDEVQAQESGGAEEAEVGGRRGEGPMIVTVSTTGISKAGRDIPLPMVPLYHLALATPHADKQRMEDLVRESGRRWCIVRASLLLNGESKGLERVRVGVEGGEGEIKREIGYRIRREDVGLWIFEELVKSSGKREWDGKMVSLTY